LTVTDVVLNCSGLRKVYGDLVAVDGVGFTIEAGETYGLLGPNGAGKTTTISMIAGLLDNDGGTAVVSGNEITTKSTAAKAAIGLVPQDLAIYPDLTARENLRFFGKLYNIGGSLNERVDEILDVIELSDRADDQTKDYSGGMKRRLNIGLGLLHKPDLLILDEPTVGVDPQSRNAILENVERLGAEGMAVLYTTHYMEEAERLCDRVGIIDEGQIIAEGTRRDLVALVGERDRLHLELSGDASTVADAVSAIDGIESCSSAGSELEVVTVSASRALPDVVLTITESGLDVHSIQVSEPDLESVFLHLTGKALRE
jgi:ABC-2 type transport system ATP-binding protein